LANGLIGDTLLQSLKVAAKGREGKSAGGWGIALLNRL